LVSALQAVKVGGEVVYSTCTLVPEEDEAVIDSILERFGQAVEVLTTDLSAPGITTNGSRKYNPEVQKSLRLWPSRFHTAGFLPVFCEKNNLWIFPHSLLQRVHLIKQGSFKCGRRKRSPFKMHF